MSPDLHARNSSVRKCCQLLATLLCSIRAGGKGYPLSFAVPQIVPFESLWRLAEALRVARPSVRTTGGKAMRHPV